MEPSRNRILDLARAKAGRLLRDPRTQVCRYELDGETDAMGQFLLWPQALPRGCEGLTITALIRETGRQPGPRGQVDPVWDGFLQEAYRGHPLGFWLDLEQLLYTRAYFTAGQLNKKGSAASFVLRRTWCWHERDTGYQLPPEAVNRFNF